MWNTNHGDDPHNRRQPPAEQARSTSSGSDRSHHLGLPPSAASALAAYQAGTTSWYPSVAHQHNASAAAVAAAALSSYQAESEAVRRQQAEFLLRHHQLAQQQLAQRLQQIAVGAPVVPPHQYFGGDGSRASSSSEPARKEGTEKAGIPYEDHSMDVDRERKAGSYPQTPPVPRGKPEAMAKALAAARIEAERKELEEERQEQLRKRDATAVARPIADDDDSDEEGDVAAAAVVGEDLDKKPAAKPTKKTTPKKSRKKPPTSHSSPSVELPTGMLLGDSVPPMTDTEYENLEALMKQFCRVPLLAEFSRPVTLLHPELAPVYSKIVNHPVDLGHVCRGIRRRQYKNTRDIRLDMWRVFANCVKFHSHPHNKEAVPSFVSIALHLREYFNNLWQEYMLPSEYQTPEHEDASAEDLLEAFAKRDKNRKKRMEHSGVLVLSKNFLVKATDSLRTFVDSGGRVDGLDKEPIFGDKVGDRDILLVVKYLREFEVQLEDICQSDAIEYTVDAFYADLTKCYTSDVLEDNPSLRNRIRSRLDRFFWKQIVPLHEANSRGVTQSSVWGNIATTIWARESSKKPFWPALCLGILSPEHQREGWHDAVTERNEERLPEKLRAQLMTAKKRCEQAQKKQGLSYFLVEFLGTHEFIWVRETDIIEHFDPKDDPNKNPKKRGGGRSSRSTNVIGSKAYQTALEECVWANEEYEAVLQDAFDYNSEEEDEDDDEVLNYSYDLLAQSDDEADNEDDHGYKYDEEGMDLSDVDEAHWLLTHEGLLDTSPAGRKNAKKRAQALKKKATAKDKKEESPKRKKGKAKDKKEKRGRKDSSEKVKVEKKELRELEKRRKKRMREREKALRSEARKHKRRRPAAHDSDDDERGLSHDKRARATAIVNAYMSRMAKDDEYKSLALGGVMTIPAAMVDSTGLLGMALAFRAAAGELSMPDDTHEQIAKTKPWTAVDTETPRTSAERVENLEKQVSLLEKEIQCVRNNTQRRRMLAAEYVNNRRQIEYEADELAARQNPWKKKKKVPVSKGSQTVDDSPEKVASSKEKGGNAEGNDKHDDSFDAEEGAEPSQEDEEEEDSVELEHEDAEDDSVELEEEGEEDSHMVDSPEAPDTKESVY